MRHLGLRTRFIAALVITSAATLAAAGLALLPQLEKRLELDRLHTVEQVAHATRPTLAAMDVADLQPRSPGLEFVARGLARRVGGRVEIRGPTGVVLADTDPDFRDVLRVPRQAVSLQRIGNERTASVSTRVRTPAGLLTILVRAPLRDERAAVGVVRRAMPLAAIAGLGTALLLGALVATRLLSRLERLRDGARRLTGEGLSEPLPRDDGGDEVGELSRALERMRVRLHEDALTRHRFLTTASHELRTPLTALRGSIDLLDEDLGRDPAAVGRARRRAGDARRQAERLSRLAEDLLDIGRLDAETVLRREPVDVVELAAVVIAEFSVVAGGRLRLAGDGAPGWALGDPTAVVRIMRILIDNALAYGPRSGPVTVIVAPGAGGSRLSITVRDAGAGILIADRERMFARFERGAAAADATGHGGFGLGLSIGRELARRMGGDIVVEDGAPTTFRVDLPAAAVPVDEEAQGPPSAPLGRSSGADVTSGVSVESGVGSV